jgi:23S rRNA (guanosine2251-2'-O)-methyltransferase
MVAGRNAVVEALQAQVPAKALYIAERVNSDNRIREALKLATQQGLPLQEASRIELDRLTGGAVHQGIALSLPPYEYAHPDDLVQAAHSAGEDPLIVALDGITDPRNLGAVVRSAAAFGAHGVVVPERRSASMTAGAWKTSAGAAVRMPVARASNLSQALRGYRSAGLFIVGLDSTGEAPIAAAQTLDRPLCLVVGSEGTGMSRIVTELCDQVVRIPIARTIESLNAGVAAGIALYEIVSARGGIGTSR